MSLWALKTLARTPPKGRRVITRSRVVETKPTSVCRTTSLPVNDAVGTMVFSPEDRSVPVPNPCMAKMGLMEALFICRDLGLKGSDDDSPGQLSLLYCAAVSVKSPLKVA